jgi:branched-subunit amino acid transport protein
MNRLNIAALLAGMVLVTYASRYPMIALLGRWELSARARRWLEFVPVAAFTAIIVPSVLAPQDSIDLSLGNHAVWAALIAIIVARLTKHTLATIATALAAYTILRWIGL